MKNSISFLLILCIAEVCISQAPCQVRFNETFLNANHIKASFQAGGNKFSSGEGVEPGFFAPYPSERRLSSIFASAPWVGGFDDAGNLKLAAEEFPVRMNDFYPGPLTPIGLPFDIPCEQFNKIWSVYGDDIKQHIEDAQDGIIDDTIASVFGWPAYGNDYFELFNGFPLPGNTEWAGFHDLNLNDKYEPDQGEYPEVYFNNTFYIPDQTLWMVFHDADSHSVSGADPLRFEFQLTAFAFNCQQNTWLRNTIFNSYKIINRAITATDNAFFGIWTDYDIGCPADDFVGSDSTRHSEFAYNQEAIDGHGENGDCETGLPTYASHPPVQSHTYLSQPMHSFILAPPPRWGDYEDPLERYNLLKGVWTDGNPIVPEGTGYMPGSSLPPTKFLFHGDPRDTSSWAETNFIQGGVDRLTVSSVKLGRLEPGASTVVESAYMFHLDTALGHLEQFGFMYSNIDSLFATVDNLNDQCVSFPYCVGRDCVWPGDFDHNGIADHEDLLTWGLMKDREGASRARLISWKGHAADKWSDSTLLDVNFKHGDGDGNGATNYEDLYPLHVNYKLTNPYYEPKAFYPVGPEIVISSDTNFQSLGGRIRDLRIEVGKNIPNVFGLAFEIDFDTTLYRIYLFEEFYCPGESPVECFFDGPYQGIDKRSNNPRFAFVKTDHQGFDLNAGLGLYLNPPGLRLKDGVDFDDLPDTVRIRLKNLIAIDSAGNDLHIGANELVFIKNMSVATTEVAPDAFYVYPNPASDFIQFDIEKGMSFRVFTIQGQLYDAFTAGPGNEVDISGYGPGIYLVKADDSGMVTKLVVN